MSGPRPRYTQQDKQAYPAYCRSYNRAIKNIAKKNFGQNFVGISLMLQAAKARVPKKWRTRAFIASVGTGEEKDGVGHTLHPNAQAG